MNTIKTATHSPRLQAWQEAYNAAARHIATLDREATWEDFHGHLPFNHPQAAHWGNMTNTVADTERARLTPLYRAASDAQVGLPKKDVEAYLDALAHDLVAYNAWEEAQA